MAPPDGPEDIFITALRQLRGLNMHLWQDVKGEQQDTYNELAFWVLLFEDSDLRACHKAFVRVVAPLMEAAAPSNFTVSYTIIAPTYEVTVETLMSNAEILTALESDGFGTMPSKHGRASVDIFGSVLSKPRP